MTLEAGEAANHLHPHGLAESFALAAKVVAQVLGGASLERALADNIARKPSLRAAVQDLSYNTLRGWGRVDYLTNKLSKNPIPNSTLRALIYTALRELASRPESAYVVVHQAVEAASLLGHERARGLVNAVLRAYQRNAAILNAEIDKTETGQYAHPQWWIDILKSAYPKCWPDILVSSNIHPPMTLRVNRRRGEVNQYSQRLAQSGVAAKLLGRQALKLSRPCPVAAIPGFLEGEVSVQDAGAQRAAVLLDVNQGMQVLDACAAPGGKTAHILELTDCFLTAMDISAERTKRINENLIRLGLTATVLVGDSIHPERYLPKQKTFDRILLDAPCTASGVVRRHPDMRWLRRETDIAAFAKTQARMLKSLWPLLRRDGKLLYTTCSVFPIENRMQIDAFLLEHPEAELLSLPDMPAAQLLPNEDADGFFYALLKKRQ
ncbi:MAG: 16S rRNA (cytosine(967)-C(5))-methyltransferase RsmB [Burkholderiales bacterium]